MAVYLPTAVHPIAPLDMALKHQCTLLLVLKHHFWEVKHQVGMQKLELLIILAA